MYSDFRVDGKRLDIFMELINNRSCRRGCDIKVMLHFVLKITVN